MLFLRIRKGLFILSATSFLLINNEDLKAARNENPWNAQEGGQAAAVQSSYDNGLAHVKAGRFKEALSSFEIANNQSPDNPDILNMLAYTQRNLGQLDQAFANYEKALKLKPRFPEAREYLGEAHLQAALQQVEILKSYGTLGEAKLAELTKTIKDAAAKL